MTEGWVYCLTNPAMPGLVKIGEVHLKDKTPEDRAEELYKTGVPARFNVEFAAKVTDSADIEDKLHLLLDTFRYNNGREFFQISVDDAKHRIETAYPDLVWRSDQNIRPAVKKTKSKTLEMRLEDAKLIIQPFLEYMKENKYFEAGTYECDNEINCRLITQEICELENALKNRSEFLKKDPELCKKDDADVKRQIKELIQKMEKLKIKVSK